MRKDALTRALSLKMTSDFTASLEQVSKNSQTSPIDLPIAGAILNAMTNSPFQNPDVAEKFASFPKPEQDGLLALRSLIFELAANLPNVGEIEETLKWGQPSYTPLKPKSGSPIRLGVSKTGGIAIYTHCQTTLISDFQNLFPNDFNYEGNRAIHFKNADEIPFDKLRMFISSALLYHVKK